MILTFETAEIWTDWFRHQ